MAMSRREPVREPRRVLRPLAGLALLGGLVWWLEPGTILAQVQRLSPGWALLALALTLPPLGLSAWRWRLTARLLGLSLGFRRALREYYLALFLNQVLPGGVAGDAARAWRHSRDSGRRGGAWRAVIIERASGQLAMALLTLAVLAASPLWHELMARAVRGVAASGWLPAGGVAVLLLVPLGWQLARRPPAALVGLGGDLRRSLLAASVWPKQLAGSLLVVVSYVLVFVCAARAIGVELPLGTLLALVPPVLLAMLIPLSLAGWGVREGAAALIWGLAGLPPAQGVAVSMAYGVVVLVASLPGGLVLLRRAARAAPARAGSGPGGSGGGGVEHQIEEGVVTAAEGPRRGAARLLQGGDGRHGESRPAGADQQRRHQQVQPMQHAGLEEARHRDAAALDQHPGETPGGQGIEHGLGGEAALGQRQRQALHMGSRWFCRARALAVQVQGRRFRVAQQAAVRRHPAAGVEDHPDRVRAGHVAHGEQRVILAGSPGADHYRVHQGAQPVQVHQALRPVDVVGVPALGGDAPVQALAELGHGQPAGSGGQREQAVEQLAGLRRDGAPGLPAGRGEAQVGHRRGLPVGMGGMEQGLPGLLQGQRRVSGAHGASCRGAECHHAQFAGVTQSASIPPGESDASG
jgi:glycosyltransferase 2 family protein